MSTTIYLKSTKNNNNLNKDDSIKFDNSSNSFKQKIK